MLHTIRHNTRMSRAKLLDANPHNSRLLDWYKILGKILLLPVTRIVIPRLHSINLCNQSGLTHHTRTLARQMGFLPKTGVRYQSGTTPLGSRIISNRTLAPQMGILKRTGVRSQFGIIPLALSIKK